MTYLGLDRNGQVDACDVAAAITPDTVLVSVVHANNETGTIQPIAGIARAARAAGLLLHVDAAQSAGKIEVDAVALGADLLTVVGHKLSAPKGIGALHVRRGIPFASTWPAARTYVTTAQNAAWADVDNPLPPSPPGL